MRLFRRHANYYLKKKKKKNIFFSPSIRMSGKSINFDDQKSNIKKSNFYRNKKIFKINDIDVNKILISKKEPYGTKSQRNTLLSMMIMMLIDHYV